jgi:hypothetical protein
MRIIHDLSSIFFWGGLYMHMQTRSLIAFVYFLYLFHECMYASMCVCVRACSYMSTYGYIPPGLSSMKNQILVVLKAECSFFSLFPPFFLFFAAQRQATKKSRRFFFYLTGPRGCMYVRRPMHMCSHMYAFGYVRHTYEHASNQFNCYASCFLII